MVENTKKYVVDSSFVLAFLLPDEFNKEVDDLFKKYSDGKVSFISTNLLNYEVGNSLKSAVLQKRVGESTANELFTSFLLLKILLYEPNQLLTFQNSVKNNLSYYDASYVQLAKQKKSKLLTLDKRLMSL